MSERSIKITITFSYSGDEIESTLKHFLLEVLNDMQIDLGGGLYGTPRSKPNSSRPMAIANVRKGLYGMWIVDIKDIWLGLVAPEPIDIKSMGSCRLESFIAALNQHVPGWR